MCNTSVYLKNQKESHCWTLSIVGWPVMIFFVWPSEKAGRAHSSRASLGWKAARGGWGGCRETACVFWAQRCATAGVGVLSSYSLHLTPSPGEGAWRRPHCVREGMGSLRLTTQSLWVLNCRASTSSGLASESMIFIIKMPRKSVFAGAVPWPLTAGNALGEREALISSKWLHCYRT